MASVTANRNTPRRKILKQGLTCCCARPCVWPASKASARVISEGSEMATTVKRLIYDDLESIPQEREGDRHEIIDGELVETPVPPLKHQIVSMNIISALDRLVRAGGLGRVPPAPTRVWPTPDN